jgi:cytoskeletal protein RodZ
MTLGQQLRAAREEKGIALKDAAEAIRARVEVLQAFEADDYASLPPPVYAKGFLKSYAQFLGLDAQKLREQLDEVIGAKKIAAPEPLGAAASHLGQSPVSQILSSMATMWGMWLLVGAILVVVVLIVWVVITASNRPPGSSSATSRPASGASSIGTTRTNVPAGSPDAYIRPVQPRAAVLDPRTNTQSSALAPQSSTARQPSPAAPPLKLSVRLTEDSWIKVVLDGKTELSYRTQKAGWTNEWHAQKSITLSTGNAAGVQAKTNGVDVGSLGPRHVKVTKTFTR